MKPKKKNKANLEKSRFIFFEIGIILALSIVLVAFSWSSIPKEIDDTDFNVQLDVEQIEKMIRLPKEEKKQEVKKLQVKTIFNPVDDENIIIEDFEFFNSEINPGDGFDIPISIEDEEFDEAPVPIWKVQEQPKFNGGDPEIEFRKFITQNIDYPDLAVENGVQGRVVLSFVIDKNGKLIDIKVLGSAHPDLDAEAVRVFEASPLWTPGERNGKKVAVVFQFPVVFKLNY